MSIINKYIWIVGTLLKAGERGLSLKEINEQWVRNNDLSNGEPIPRQTFDRWKGRILDMFGVVIDCRLRGGYRYYIYNPDALQNGELTRWLLDTYATAGTLTQSMALKDRIIVEEIPSNRDFLTDIIQAMKENRVMQLTYRGFGRDEAHTFPTAPYCLKMFQKRWYMLALSVNEDMLRLYALDRMEDVEFTDERFALPEDFDAREHFSTFFGVVLDWDVAVERVVLRAYSEHAPYLRTLPLHTSQREIGSGDGYTDFELRLRPTYDFVMELLRVGSLIEVLEPQSLRDTMRGWIGDMSRMYDDGGRA